MNRLMSVQNDTKHTLNEYNAKTGNAGGWLVG